MDREQLFQNLCELEKQLKGIKSATEQVNAIIATDREMISAVSAFSDNVEKTLNSIKDVYNGDILKVREATISSLKKSSDDFTDKMSAITYEINRMTDNFRSVVENNFKPLIINDFGGMLDGKLKPYINNELPQSLKLLTEDYSKNLQAIEVAMKESASTLSSETTKALEKCATEFDGRLNGIADKVSEETSGLEKLISEKLKPYFTIELPAVFKSITDGYESSLNLMLTRIRGEADNFAEGTSKAMFSLTSIRDMIESHLESLQGYATELKGNLSNMQSAIDAGFTMIVSDNEKVKKSILELSSEVTKMDSSTSRSIVESEKRIDKSINKYAPEINARLDRIEKDNKFLKLILVMIVLLQFITMMFPLVKSLIR